MELTSCVVACYVLGRMLYLSGFNGFGQCSGIMGEEITEPSLKKFVKVKEYGPDLEISISWCNILIISGNILQLYLEGSK
jgi:hypothetical protein